MSKEARADYLRRMGELRNAHDWQEKLGGKNALSVLEQVSGVLFQPEVNQQSAAQFLQTLDGVNPNLLNSTAEILLQGVWGLNDTHWQSMIDRQLQNVFGQGMTRQKIEQIGQMLDKGLFDEEFLLGEYQGGFVNPKIEALQAQISQLEKGYQEQSRQSEAQREFKEAVKQRSDEYIFSEINSVINPIIEKLAWAKSEGDPSDWAEFKEMFGEMRESWLKDFVRTSPEYKTIQYLLETGQGYDQKGNLSHLYLMKLEALQGKATAKMREAGRKGQRTLTKSLLSSRNAQIGQPSTEPTVQPQQVVNQPTVQPPQPPQVAAQDTQAERDALWKQYQSGFQQNEQLRRGMMTGRR